MNIRSHTFLVLALLALLFMAVWPPAASAGGESGKKANGASRLEPIEGAKLSRVVLTQSAAQRLDIRTSEIRSDGSGKLIAPYAALIYDVSGAAWVYTNSTPLAYLRHAVVVESIVGPDVYLAMGPAAGTQVVTVGASELYGAESGVGH